LIFKLLQTLKIKDSLSVSFDDQINIHLSKLNYSSRSAFGSAQEGYKKALGGLKASPECTIRCDKRGWQNSRKTFESFKILFLKREKIVN
jgi:hypothetical protein